MSLPHLCLNELLNLKKNVLRSHIYKKQPSTGAVSTKFPTKCKAKFKNLDPETTSQQKSVLRKEATSLVFE